MPTHPRESRWQSTCSAWACWGSWRCKGRLSAMQNRHSLNPMRNDDVIRRIVTITILAGLLMSLGLWCLSYTTLAWSNGRTIISLSGGAIRYVEFLELDAGPEKWWWSGFQGFDTAFVPFGGRSGGGMVSFVLPMWMPTALFATALWIGCRPARRRRRRKKLGQCLNCGYSLTGLGLPRCPECGTQFDPGSQRGTNESPQDRAASQ